MTGILKRDSFTSGRATWLGGVGICGLLALAELATQIDPRIGLGTHAALVLGGAAAASLTRREEHAGPALALAVVSMARLVSYAIPLRTADALISAAAVAGVMTVSVVLLAGVVPKPGAKSAGRPPWSAALGASLVVGLVFGLLRRAPASELLHQQGGLPAVMGSLVLAVLVEEMLYRRILLDVLTPILGSRWSLAGGSVVYASTFVWTQSVLAILVGAIGGILWGGLWIRYRSLTVVVAGHVIAATVSLVVLPALR